MRRKLYLLKYRRRQRYHHLAPAVVALRLEVVGDVDAQRGVAVGVVIRGDLSDEALHLLRVERLDDVRLAAVEIDGVGEDQRRRRTAVHRADDDGLCLDGDIRYSVIFPRRAAQREPRGGVGVGLPVISRLIRLVHAVQHLVVREVVEYRVNILTAEPLSRVEGQFEGGALDVAHLYIGIIGIDARPLRRRSVEPFGALREELVERIGGGDHHRR